MAIYKCKMCGDTLTIQNGQTVVTCESCGTTQTVHGFDNEKKTTFFKRANALRFKCEFDKAAGLYETIVSEFPNEAEAYWGLVLCKFGIEYVDDPGTGEKVPTCHRTQFASIFDDSDYKNAIKNADAVAEGVYKKEAKEISKLQKAILEISSKEDPFDIFICYKETDLSGNRTSDSVLAQDIYKELTNEGYRVFFSRITLEDKLGAQYEPYIFAALHSSKIMLHVTTSDENSEAVWVRNEWSRYLSLIKEGQKKVLIPCYKNISPYSLPDELQNLQGQDMGKLGSMQDLVRGINKILGKLNITKNRKDLSKNSLSLSEEKEIFESKLRKGYIYLSKSMWSDAAESFNSAIKLSEKCGRAYIGLMLAESKHSSVDSFIDSEENNNQYLDNLNWAKSFADEACLIELKEIDDKINKNKYKKTREEFVSILKANSWEKAKQFLDGHKEYREDFKRIYFEYLYKYVREQLNNFCNITDLSLIDNLLEKLNGFEDMKDYSLLISFAKIKKKEIIDGYENNVIDNLSFNVEKCVNVNDLKAAIARLLFIKNSFANLPYKNDSITFKIQNIIDDAHRFILGKSYSIIREFNTLNECHELIDSINLLDDKDDFKDALNLIDEKIDEIKETRHLLKVKRRKKNIKISVIISAITASLIGISFGIKAIFDEQNKANLMITAANYAKSGNYEYALNVYESLGNYKDAQRKVEICKGLFILKDSVTTKDEADLLNGIRKITSNGEKVDISYISEKPIEENDPSDPMYYFFETASDESYSLCVPASNNGYTFEKWFTTSFVYDGSSTVSLSALSVWSVSTFSITYVLDGGINHPENRFSYNIESPTFELKEPTRYGYCFLGWSINNDSTYITQINKGSFGDITLYAMWDANIYNITFLNWDGSLLEKTTCRHGETAIYSGPTPQRERTQQYSFVWNGSWDKPLTNITKDTEFIAQYTNTLNKYTVTFKNYDGSILSTTEVEYGGLAVYNGELVIKPQDDRHSYYHNGWDVSLDIPIVEDCVRVATFNVVNRYICKFLNYDGTLLDEVKVDDGSDAIYSGPTPQRERTQQYSFVWNGSWDKPLTNITKDTEFIAQYTNTLNKYTVTFKNYDGSILSTTEVEYGGLAVYYGETPKRNADFEYYYIFKGWDISLLSIYDDVTATAMFDKKDMNVIYELYNNSFSIIGTKEDKDIYVPSNINGIPVKTIKTGAFKHGIQNIVIDADLYEVEKEAFYNILTLEKVVFSGSVERIDQSAFYCCSRLKELYIPDNTSFSAIFSNCGVVKLSLPRLDIRLKFLFDGVCPQVDYLIVRGGDISEGTFESYHIPQIIEIGENVRYISSKAFEHATYDNEFRQLYIVTKCSNISSKWEIDGFDFARIILNFDSIITYYSFDYILFNDGTCCSAFAYKFNEDFKYIYIPSNVFHNSTEYSVRYVAKYIFHALSGDEMLYIPQSVIYVGSGIFTYSYNTHVFYENSAIPSTWDSDWRCITGYGGNVHYNCASNKEYGGSYSVVSPEMGTLRGFNM